MWDGSNRYRRFVLRRIGDPRTPQADRWEVERAVRRQWDEAALHRHRDALLTEVLAAARKTAHYPRTAGETILTAISSAPELARIAPLPRAELRAGTARFANAAIPSEQVDVTFTSGTQGAASHVLRSRASVRRRAICERRWYQGLGLPGIFELTCATPWPGRGRDNTAVRDPRVGYRETGLDDLVERLGTGRSAGELLLVGPDMLPELAARVHDWGGIAAVASSFEIRRPEHTAAWSDACPPLAEMYCAAEISVPLAYSFPGCSGMHVNADYVYAEVVDDDGAPLGYHRAGRLAVTDLVNTAMPLLRYLIGDAVILRPPSDCGCGRVLPLIEVLGRLPDADRRIGQAPVRRLLGAVAEVGAGRFLLEHRDETTMVVHLEQAAHGARAEAALGAEVPGIAVRSRPLGERLASLARPGGLALSGVPRHPYRAAATAAVPHRIRVVQESAAARAEPRSPRSAARRLLRERYRAAAIETRIPVLDASRSMYPLFGAATRVTVAWGVPDPDRAVGSVVLVELPQDILAAHRVAARRTRDGVIEILQCADNYDRTNPYSAFWVPLDSVLGTVVAATTTRAAKTSTLRLTGTTARWSGRMVAAADRGLVAAQRRHRPLPAVLAFALAQRCAFRTATVVLRWRSTVFHRLQGDNDHDVDRPALSA